MKTERPMEPLAEDHFVLGMLVVYVGLMALLAAVALFWSREVWAPLVAGFGVVLLWRGIRRIRQGLVEHPQGRRGGEKREGGAR